MRTTTAWAFWRRTQYTFGFLVFISLIGTGIYFGYIYEASTCFDRDQNGEERGVDCGGSCIRICSLDVQNPQTLWARAFEIREGQYNAVTYIENRNLTAGTKKADYTFSFYDDKGLITEKKGSTVLPPNSVYPIFEGNISTGGRVPTKTTLELDDIEVWQPAEYGREQFIVERRELLNVDKSPRLNATLTNTELSEAFDVEIVATIFDERGNALTSSRTNVPRFPGRETQDVVFTWPEPIAKTIRSCEVPTDVILAIDLSGSMNDDGGDPAEPISSVLKAAKAFAERLKDKDQAGIVTFATEAEIVSQLSGDTNGAGKIVSGLSILPADETGSTNTGEGIKLVGEELMSGRHNENARKVMVLLTDGLANKPGEDPEQYALDEAKLLRDNDVEIYSIGLGEKVNKEFLKEMASDKDHYYLATSAGTVDQIYRAITSAICEDGPAVIDIIPKTETSFTPLR